jgi:hypothetical protein
MEEKKHYSVQWENEEAVSFEVDGVKYDRLRDIPDKRDKRKLREMMSDMSQPDFDEQEWEEVKKEGNKAQQIILWVFGGVAVLMLVIAGFATAGNISKLSKEKSAPGVVIDTVVKREYVNEQDRIIQEYSYPVVRFRAEDGRVREVQMSEGSDPPSFETGDEVTVRYNPEHPLDARIDSVGSSMLMWVFPGILGILGLAFGGAVFMVRWLVTQ